MLISQRGAYTENLVLPHTAVGYLSSSKQKVNKRQASICCDLRCLAPFAFAKLRQQQLTDYWSAIVQIVEMDIFFIWVVWG